jgi:hypothetical protein
MRDEFIRFAAALARGKTCFSGDGAQDVVLHSPNNQTAIAAADGSADSSNT